MTARNNIAPTFGKNALALIRLIISSHFIAISLGLIDGVSPGLALETWLPRELAMMIGSMVMLVASLLIFLGLFLRFSCLYLALLVLASSLIQNVFWPDAINVPALWHDVVMVSALLLIYGSLSGHGQTRAALVRKVRKVRHIDIGQPIMPRRVQAGGSVARDREPLRDLTVTIADFNAIRRRLDAEVDDISKDIVNIFAEPDKA